jgi:hypothetical protein
MEVTLTVAQVQRHEIVRAAIDGRIRPGRIAGGSGLDSDHHRKRRGRGPGKEKAL